MLLMRSFAISDTESALAANGTTTNLVNGTRLSPVVENGIISVWAVASVDSVKLNLQVQNENICSNFEVSDANRYPIRDEDWVFSGIPVSKGDTIEFTFKNENAAAADIKYIINFTPAMGRARRPGMPF